MDKLNFDPWFDFKQLLRQVERAENRQDYLGGSRSQAETGPVFTPLADVIESEEAVTILIELAGASPEQVNLEVREGTLWVFGERETYSGDGAYRVLERAHGRFLRRFELPKSVVRAKISAAMRCGLLEIRLPKRGPEELRRRIEVK